jgi:hypothetical protein
MDFDGSSNDFTAQIVQFHKLASFKAQGIGEHKGLFSILPICCDQVLELVLMLFPCRSSP